jgi:hypothetical protein
MGNWNERNLLPIALLSLPENKNSSQRMKPLLNGRSSDRKLIETYLFKRLK